MGSGVADGRRGRARGDRRRPGPAADARPGGRARLDPARGAMAERGRTCG